MCLCKRVTRHLHPAHSPGRVPAPGQKGGTGLTDDGPVRAAGPAEGGARPSGLARRPALLHDPKRIMSSSALCVVRGGWGGGSQLLYRTHSRSQRTGITVPMLQIRKPRPRGMSPKCERKSGCLDLNGQMPTWAAPATPQARVPRSFMPHRSSLRGPSSHGGRNACERSSSSFGSSAFSLGSLQGSFTGQFSPDGGCYGLNRVPCGSHTVKPYPQHSRSPLWKAGHRSCSLSLAKKQLQAGPRSSRSAVWKRTRTQGVQAASPQAKRRQRLQAKHGSLEGGREQTLAHGPREEVTPPMP